MDYLLKYVKMGKVIKKTPFKKEEYMEKKDLIKEKKEGEKKEEKVSRKPKKDKSFKNLIIASLSIVAVAAAALSYFLIRGEKDQVVLFLERMEEETGIDFSEIEEIELKWNIETEEKIETLIIEGKGFKADSLLSEKERRLSKFLEDSGFKVDMLNIAAGTVAYLTGYEKEEMVCLVYGKILEADTGGQKRDVEVSCGLMRN